MSHHALPIPAQGLLGRLEAEGEDVSLTAVYLAAVCPPEQSAQLLSAVEDPIQKARLSNDITRLHTRRSQSGTRHSPHTLTTSNLQDLQLLDSIGDDASGRASLAGYLQQDGGDNDQALRTRESKRKVEAWNDAHQGIALQPALSVAERQQQQRVADLASLQARMQALACMGKLDGAALLQAEQQLRQLKAQLPQSISSPAGPMVSIAPPVRSKSDVYAQKLVDQMEAVRSSLETASPPQTTEHGASMSQALQCAMQQVTELRHQAEARRSRTPSPARPTAPWSSPAVGISPRHDKHAAHTEHLKQLEQQLSRLMAKHNQPPDSPTRSQLAAASTSDHASTSAAPSPRASVGLPPALLPVSGSTGSTPSTPRDVAAQDLRKQAINMFAAKAIGNAAKSGSLPAAVSLPVKAVVDVERLRQEAAALLKQRGSVGAQPKVWTGRDI